MDNNATPAGMITVSEAARKLGRSIEQVRRYLREGKLRGQRIGQQWFIAASDLPLGYTPQQPVTHTLRESAAGMRPAATSDAGRAALLARIDRDREAIRQRLGGDVPLDIVKALREIRAGH